MPAPKPVGLHTRHATKPEIEQRAAQEEALTGGTKLPAMPARLKDHPVAQATWRRMKREYDKVEAVVVTRLDMDQLIDYCILEEQKSEIDQMRRAAYDSMLVLAKELEKLRKKGDIEGAAKVASRVIDATNEVVQLDSRADRKRDLLMKLRQSLYLTPKARAGAAPKTKLDEPPEDPFEQLLNRLPTRVPVKSGEPADDEA
jgi:phage terminase small subunit